MEESAMVLLSDSSISKFGPEMFVFWIVEINQSGLNMASSCSGGYLVPVGVCCDPGLRKPAIGKL